MKRVLTEQQRINKAVGKRVYAQKQRYEAIEMLGGICVECGFSDKRALVFDHIKPQATPGEKREHPRKVVQRCRKGDTENIQLLCANCHMVKTAIEKTQFLQKHSLQDRKTDSFVVAQRWLEQEKDPSVC